MRRRNRKAQEEGNTAGPIERQRHLLGRQWRGMIDANIHEVSVLIGKPIPDDL
jgi:hypothetical protein